MEKKFYVKVIINAVELIKNNFEIKEEVRNSFIATDYYVDSLKEFMAENDIQVALIEAFSRKGHGLIFNKYVTVDEGSIEFDYDEAILRNDRGDCCFKVLCTYDTSKFIKDIRDLKVIDSPEKPLAEVNGWKLVNESCLEYAKKMWDDCGIEVWGFIRMECFAQNSVCRVRATTNVSMVDYTKEYIHEVVSPYYDSVEQIEKENPEHAQQIICEKLFSAEEGDNTHFIDEVDSVADAYRIIKRWLREGGILCEAAKTLIANHERNFKSETSEDSDARTSQWYLNKYNELWNKIHDKWKDEPVDVDYQTNMEFEDEATANEIVGYYIAHYGQNAYKQWMENQWTSEWNKDARASFREQDEEVTKILEDLYRAITVREVVWFNPEGNTEDYLPENQLVNIGNERDEFVTADFIIESLEDMTGYTPISFKWFYKSLEGSFENKKLIEEMPAKKEAEPENLVRRFATQIVWYTGSESDGKHLPNQVEIPEHIADDGVEDYLSDEYGYLIHSYSLEEFSEDSIEASAPSKTSTERSFTFKSELEMYDSLKDVDLYNPLLDGGTYVYLYSDDGSIAVHTHLSISEAKKLSSDMKERDENGWNAFTKGDTYLPHSNEAMESAAIGFCMDNYASKGWIIADEETFSETNEKYVLNRFDIYPTDWIIGISGSDMNNVMTQIVTGTTDQVRRFLLDCVFCDRDGDEDNWDSGCDCLDDITYNDDGTLYAFGVYKDCHMDYTARPVSSVRHTNLNNIKLKIGD